MPYGLPQEKGGDSAENVARMERCVEGVKRGHPDWDDARCIATCKVSLGFTKSLEEIALEWALEKYNQNHDARGRFTSESFDAQRASFIERYILGLGGPGQRSNPPSLRAKHDALRAQLRDLNEKIAARPEGAPNIRDFGEDHVDDFTRANEKYAAETQRMQQEAERLGQERQALWQRIQAGDSGTPTIEGSMTGDGLSYRSPSYMRHFFKFDTVEKRMEELNSHEGKTVMLTRKAGTKGPAWGPGILHRNDATSVKIGEDVVQAMDVADVAVYAPVSKEVQALDWALAKFNPYHDTHGRFSSRGIGRVAPGVATHPAISGTMVATDEDMRRRDKPLDVDGAITTLHMDLEEAGFKRRGEGDYENDFSERITMKEIPGTPDLVLGVTRRALAVSMYHRVGDSMPFSSERLETQQQFEFSNVRTRLLIERMTLSDMEKRALFRGFLKFNPYHDALGRFSSHGGGGVPAIAGRKMPGIASEEPTHQGHRVNPYGWTGNAAAQLKTLKKPGGGFSSRPTQRHPTHGEGPKDGFMVSDVGSEESFPAKELSTMKLATYMAKHAAALRAPNKYFGGWHDAKTGRIYLDVSTNYRSQGEAVAVAKTNKQLAFYDVKAGKTVYLKELLASRPTRKAADSEPRKVYLPKDDPEEAYRLLEELVGESTEKAD